MAGSSPCSSHWRKEDKQWSSTWLKNGSHSKWSCDSHWECRDDLFVCPGGAGNRRRNRPKCTVIFLHSCGGKPSEVLDYLPHLRVAGLHPSQLRVVAPYAPWRVDPQGWKGHSWFDYTTNFCSEGYADCVEYDHLVSQRNRLVRLIQDELNLLGAGGKIILGGLSQGASMALDVMLHLPTHLDSSLAGVFCLRGMMQKESLYNLPTHKVKRRCAACRVLVFHGTGDDVIPLAVARKSYKWLQEQRFRVQVQVEQGMGHGGFSALEGHVLGKFVAAVAWQ